MDSLSRRELIEKLHSYRFFTPEESAAVPRFLSLLTSPEAYDRGAMPGHITGSAWVIDPGGTHTLLVHHAKLNIWVQPGGHADGDEDVLAVALREAREETGLQGLSVVPDFLDIDIHTIPARPEIGEHQHFDVRFLFVAGMSAPLVVSDESWDVRWIALDQLESYSTDASVLRLRQKLQARHGPKIYPFDP